MDSECGVSVAPPGMCSTYPIIESEVSRRGQEFTSASEDTWRNLVEQQGVVFDTGGETTIKYQTADVSRPLKSNTKICDADHPDCGNHVIFRRHGGMVVNLETKLYARMGVWRNLLLRLSMMPIQISKMTGNVRTTARRTVSR